MLVSAATTLTMYRRYQRHRLPATFLRAFAVSRTLRLMGDGAVRGGNGVVVDSVTRIIGITENLRKGRRQDIE